VKQKIAEANKKPTLVILAAGLGSRYGGLKQIDPVGPNGEIIIDYSIYDAISVGFGKLVFVIRHYFEDAFREKIGRKFDGVVETSYAYQEIDACLDDFALPPDREKPWGTGHAILVAEELIDEPFAVINADDFYGRDSLRAIAEFLSKDGPSEAMDYAMIGYILSNTLSNHGSVARGVCEVDEDMLLTKVTECTGVARNEDHVAYVNADGRKQHLTGDEIASMNLWGFKPSVFNHLRTIFREFLAQRGSDRKAEFFIPVAVDNLIKSGKARVNVLVTHDTWFGVTYRPERDIAAERVLKLIDDGVYPYRLWDI
jgi:dTDP-glucose pyrophosphorylase